MAEEAARQEELNGEADWQLPGETPPDRREYEYEAYEPRRLAGEDGPGTATQGGQDRPASRHGSPRGQRQGSPRVGSIWPPKGKSKAFSDLPPESLLPTPDLPLHHTRGQGRAGEDRGSLGGEVPGSAPPYRGDQGIETDDGSDCDPDMEAELAKAELAALETQALVDAQARRSERLARIEATSYGSPRTSVRNATEIYQEQMGEERRGTTPGAADREGGWLTAAGVGHAKQSHLGSLLFN